MDRLAFVEHDDRWFGTVRTEPGLAGGWHHHADRDSYVFVLSGSITLEYGPGGGEALTASAGDLVFNPARLVHREITGPEGPAQALVIRIGQGPLTVNVDGPDLADPDTSA
jgi:uncharacterized RmlC-like cupin family protein